ncbi:formate dehydrogenase subunit delta [Halomonas halocynthiae]|uniref:formate dehydrogenase subunit delta n=1 Tax=Halomonas halocynthiae TaxID=176290 RepID=UPI00041F1095|nr:formate dehydrogenase subunit delta [Halomonas halocynthiae]
MSAHNSTLIHMVNQIAENLRHGRSNEQAVEETASHLEKFWARPMKAKIIDSLGDSENGLIPAARDAVEQLKQRSRTS